MHFVPTPTELCFTPDSLRQDRVYHLPVFNQDKYIGPEQATPLSPESPDHFVGSEDWQEKTPETRFLDTYFLKRVTEIKQNKNKNKKTTKI